jgi:hypothetical protein
MSGMSQPFAVGPATPKQIAAISSALPHLDPALRRELERQPEQIQFAIIRWFIAVQTSYAKKFPGSSNPEALARQAWERRQRALADAAEKAASALREAREADRGGYPSRGNWNGSRGQLGGFK